MNSDFETHLQSLRTAYTEATARATRAGTLADAIPIEQVGARIRAERRRQQLTLRQLAELSGSSQATLSRIEGGSLAVQLDTLVQVAQALGLQLWIG
jgi:ribosome-binding protein aMBF1 (putative translation factor)